MATHPAKDGHGTPHGRGPLAHRFPPLIGFRKLVIATGTPHVSPMGDATIGCARYRLIHQCHNRHKLVSVRIDPQDRSHEKHRSSVANKRS
jgi:hypothetical protein